MKYVRRFLWFIASRMLIFTAIVLALILAFYLPLNAANFSILLSDGMQLRTQVILTGEGSDSLANFFREEFILADEALQLGMSPESPYANYSISSFESEVSVEWVWSWPWEDTAQVIIVHRVPEIKGSVLSSKKSLVESGALSATPPVWQSWRYRMTMLEENGQWKIAGMVRTQDPVDNA